MAVVALPTLAPQGAFATDEWELRSLTQAFRGTLSPVIQTRGGGSDSYWAATLRYHNLVGSPRARVRSWLTSSRGMRNSFYVPLYESIRGSFPAPELLTNNTFTSGTTGWSSAGRIITASDGMLRVTREAHNSTGDLVNANSGAAITVTQYAPYAARSIDHQGRSALWSSGPQLGSGPGGEEYGRANAVGFGLKTLVSVIPATAAHFGMVDYDTGANVAGDFISFSYASLARCALVDNGPNFTQRSSEIDNAYWTKNASSISANSTAPDGSSTADVLIENGATAQHTFTVSPTRTSSVADWCIYGYFARASGTRNIRLVIGRDGSNYADAIFNLGSGTLAQAAAAAGDATNARAFIVDAGGGWYYCAVIGRLTATTGLLLQVELANGTSVGYAGDSTSSVYCWQVGSAQSSVPTRGMQTTSAGDADGVAQTGSALHLKGLPASTNGLLLQDDPAEIIIGTRSQLVRTVGSLNSDAAGLGYWQFEPPLRPGLSPSDNAAVIIRNPLCHMKLGQNFVRWSEHDDGFSDVEFTAEEELAP